jgi:cell division protein ZapD
VKKKIVYEQPLNERMRTLLRLEHLFMGMMYHLKGPAEWDSRAGMDSIINIIDFMGRVDFRIELIKDLEHHIVGLERWQRTPQVNTERVAALVNQAVLVLEKLQASSEFSLDNLLQNQLINQIRQRSNIPGGSCRCDLPNYYHWLQKNPKQRQSDLSEWLVPIELLREALELDLYLIRNSAISSQEIAPNGFFQSKLDTHSSYQLIQVMLPIEYPGYPEINGGKQRFTIRFFEVVNIEEKPVQTQQDIHFELNCCMI